LQTHTPFKARLLLTVQEVGVVVGVGVVAGEGVVVFYCVVTSLRSGYEHLPLLGAVDVPLDNGTAAGCGSVCGMSATVHHAS